MNSYEGYTIPAKELEPPYSPEVPEKMPEDVSYSNPEANSYFRDLCTRWGKGMRMKQDQIILEAYKSGTP